MSDINQKGLKRFGDVVRARMHTDSATSTNGLLFRQIGEPTEARVWPTWLRDSPNNDATPTRRCNP